MSAVLSPYWSPWHRWQSTEDYFKALQPPWLRIHQPTALDIHNAQTWCPNAKLMLRSWDIDDHNDERKQEMYRNPKGAARQLVDRWNEMNARLANELDRNGWHYDESKWYYGLWNEPDNEHIPQLVEATAEVFRLSVLPFGVAVPGVGRFPKPDEPKPGWELFKPLEKRIRDGGHILIVHEYWQPEGPRCVWTDKDGNARHDAYNLAWRHHSIPLDVPILIGESGANGYIFNRHSNKDDAGWGKFMDAATYAAQVREYIEGCDNRVEGVCLYMEDYHSDQWKSFDTTPAHAELLAVADAQPGVAYKSDAPAQHDVHVPIITTPPAPTSAPFDPVADENWYEYALKGHIHAPNGMVVRDGPGLDYPIVNTLPTGAEIVADVEVERTGHTWIRVGSDEWIAKEWVSFSGPTSAPTQPPPEPKGSAIDPLVLEAIVNIESRGKAYTDRGSIYGVGRLPIIRFEAHVFNQRTQRTISQFTWDREKPWTGQKYLTEEGWRDIHTGLQGSEYDAFDLAESIDEDAAYESISIGLGQIMGFNAQRVGYSSAKAMFDAFSRSEHAQVFGVINYILSDYALFEAVRRKDWRTIAALYNGAGNVDVYAPQLQAEYERLANG